LRTRPETPAHHPGAGVPPGGPHRRLDGKDCGL